MAKKSEDLFREMEDLFQNVEMGKKPVSAFIQELKGKTEKNKSIVNPYIGDFLRELSGTISSPDNLDKSERYLSIYLELAKAGFIKEGHIKNNSFRLSSSELTALRELNGQVGTFKGQQEDAKQYFLTKEFKRVFEEAETGSKKLPSFIKEVKAKEKENKDLFDRSLGEFFKRMSAVTTAHRQGMKHNEYERYKDIYLELIKEGVITERTLYRYHGRALTSSEFSALKELTDYLKKSPLTSSVFKGEPGTKTPEAKEARETVRVAQEVKSKKGREQEILGSSKARETFKNLIEYRKRSKYKGQDDIVFALIEKDSEGKKLTKEEIDKIETYLSRGVREGWTLPIAEFLAMKSDKSIYWNTIALKLKKAAENNRRAEILNLFARYGEINTAGTLFSDIKRGKISHGQFDREIQKLIIGAPEEYEKLLYIANYFFKEERETGKKTRGKYRTIMYDILKHKKEWEKQKTGGVEVVYDSIDKKGPQEGTTVHQYYDDIKSESGVDIRTIDQEEQIVSYDTYFDKEKKKRMRMPTRFADVFVLFNQGKIKVEELPMVLEYMGIQDPNSSRKAGKFIKLVKEITSGKSSFSKEEIRRIVISSLGTGKSSDFLIDTLGSQSVAGKGKIPDWEREIIKAYKGALSSVQEIRKVIKGEEKKYLKLTQSQKADYLIGKTQKGKPLEYYAKPKEQQKTELVISEIIDKKKQITAIQQGTITREVLKELNNLPIAGSRSAYETRDLARRMISLIKDQEALGKKYSFNRILGQYDQETVDAVLLAFEKISTKSTVKRSKKTESFVSQIITSMGSVGAASGEEPPVSYDDVRKAMSSPESVKFSASTIKDKWIRSLTTETEDKKEKQSVEYLQQRQAKATSLKSELQYLRETTPTSRRIKELEKGILELTIQEEKGAETPVLSNRTTQGIAYHLLREILNNLELGVPEKAGFNQMDYDLFRKDPKAFLDQIAASMEANPQKWLKKHGGITGELAGFFAVTADEQDKRVIKVAKEVRNLLNGVYESYRASAEGISYFETIDASKREAKNLSKFKGLMLGELSNESKKEVSIGYLPKRRKGVFESEKTITDSQQKIITGAVLKELGGVPGGVDAARKLMKLFTDQSLIGKTISLDGVLRSYNDETIDSVLLAFANISKKSYVKNSKTMESFVSQIIFSLSEETQPISYNKGTFSSADRYYSVPEKDGKIAETKVERLLKKSRLVKSEWGDTLEVDDGFGGIIRVSGVFDEIFEDDQGRLWYRDYKARAESERPFSELTQGYTGILYIKKNFPHKKIGGIVLEHLDPSTGKLNHVVYPYDERIEEEFISVLRLGALVEKKVITREESEALMTKTFKQSLIKEDADAQKRIATVSQTDIRQLKEKLKTAITPRSTAELTITKYEEAEPLSTSGTAQAVKTVLADHFRGTGYSFIYSKEQEKILADAKKAGGKVVETSASSFKAPWITLPEGISELLNERQGRAADLRKHLSTLISGTGIYKDTLKDLIRYSAQVQFGSTSGSMKKMETNFANATVRGTAYHALREIFGKMEMGDFSDAKGFTKLDFAEFEKNPEKYTEDLISSINADPVGWLLRHGGFDNELVGLFTYFGEDKKSAFGIKLGLTKQSVNLIRSLAQSKKLFGEGIKSPTGEIITRNKVIGVEVGGGALIRLKKSNFVVYGGQYDEFFEDSQGRIWYRDYKARAESERPFEELTQAYSAFLYLSQTYPGKTIGGAIFEHVVPGTGKINYKMLNFSGQMMKDFLKAADLYGQTILREISPEQAMVEMPQAFRQAFKKQVASKVVIDKDTGQGIYFSPNREAATPGHPRIARSIAFERPKKGYSAELYNILVKTLGFSGYDLTDEDIQRLGIKERKEIYAEEAARIFGVYGVEGLTVGRPLIEALRSGDAKTISEEMRKYQEEVRRSSASSAEWINVSVPMSLSLLSKYMKEENGVLTLFDRRIVNTNQGWKYADEKGAPVSAPITNVQLNLTKILEQYAEDRDYSNPFIQEVVRFLTSIPELDRIANLPDKDIEDMKDEKGNILFSRDDLLSAKKMLWIIRGKAKQWPKEGMEKNPASDILVAIGLGERPQRQRSKKGLGQKEFENALKYLFLPEKEIEGIKVKQFLPPEEEFGYRFIDKDQQNGVQKLIEEVFFGGKTPSYEEVLEFCEEHDVEEIEKKFPELYNYLSSVLDYFPEETETIQGKDPEYYAQSGAGFRARRRNRQSINGTIITDINKNQFDVSGLESIKEIEFVDALPNQDSFAVEGRLYILPDGYGYIYSKKENSWVNVGMKTQNEWGVFAGIHPEIQEEGEGWEGTGKLLSKGLYSVSNLWLSKSTSVVYYFKLITQGVEGAGSYLSLMEREYPEEQKEVNLGDTTTQGKSSQKALEKYLGVMTEHVKKFTIYTSLYTLRPYEIKIINLEITKDKEYENIVFPASYKIDNEVYFLELTTSGNGKKATLKVYLKTGDASFEFVPFPEIPKSKTLIEEVRNIEKNESRPDGELWRLPEQIGVPHEGRAYLPEYVSEEPLNYSQRLKKEKIQPETEEIASVTSTQLWSNYKTLKEIFKNNPDFVSDIFSGNYDRRKAAIDIIRTTFPFLPGEFRFTDLSDEAATAAHNIFEDFMKVLSNPDLGISQNQAEYVANILRRTLHAPEEHATDTAAFLGAATVKMINFGGDFFKTLKEVTPTQLKAMTFAQELMEEIIRLTEEKPELKDKKGELLNEIMQKYISEMIEDRSHGDYESFAERYGEDAANLISRYMRIGNLEGEEQKMFIRNLGIVFDKKFLKEDPFAFFGGKDKSGKTAYQVMMEEGVGPLNIRMWEGIWVTDKFGSRRYEEKVKNPIFGKQSSKKSLEEYLTGKGRSEFISGDWETEDPSRTRKQGKEDGSGMADEEKTEQTVTLEDGTKSFYIAQGPTTITVNGEIKLNGDVSVGDGQSSYGGSSGGSYGGGSSRYGGPGRGRYERRSTWKKSEYSSESSSEKLTTQERRLQTLKEGSIGDVLSTSFGGYFNRLSSYGIAYRMISTAIRTITNLINQAKELDKTLSNLRVVTGYNKEEATNLMQTYSRLGEELSATTNEVATAANDWFNLKSRSVENKSL